MIPVYDGELLLVGLLVVITQKLNKKVDKVPLSKSVKELVSGNPPVQNEILGNLQLGLALSARFSGNIRMASSPEWLHPRCWEVSTPQLSRFNCRRTGVSVHLAQMASDCLGPWSPLNDSVQKLKQNPGLFQSFLFTLSIRTSASWLVAFPVVVAVQKEV